MGCCGAMTGNNCITKSYACILFRLINFHKLFEKKIFWNNFSKSNKNYHPAKVIVVILEIIAGIIGFAKKDDVAKLLGGVAEDSLSLWNCTGTECNEAAIAWDSIQVSQESNFFIKKVQF